MVTASVMLTMEVIICICTIWFSISEVSMVFVNARLVSWVIIRVMKIRHVQVQVCPSWRW